MNTVTKPMGVLVRLRSIEPSLKPAEKNVANYILNNAENILDMTITCLSEKTNSSLATIVRLCKKIGCTGFQELKNGLLGDLVDPIKGIHEEIELTDSMPAIAQKVFYSGMQTLSDTLKMIDYNSLEQAVNAIAQARKVDFYGVASSGFIALDAHHKMFKTGIQSAAYVDPHMQIISAGFLTEKDVAVGISHSGSSKDIIQTLKHARQAGAKTICITSYMKSPITKVADISLYVSARETTFRSDAMAARIAHLCIIDLLIVGVSFLRQNESFSAIEKVRKSIALKRY
ncbi:SIS domain-containing protein [Thermanaerosceptrum fracticalcis]|jgi:DNA-binding MurR/RpiR family transcriptional regulator|uniref:SIS domain-containing protein n=1 Tax=Thermanaerosceptrum fracticalcis TaxID=1712410 RepID=A0A7G6E5I0_THEFR|nr:MurR/RpiR family transcriptional regulator [Thermanaerosceptrum fracticalcis]QNB47334.1 SIS domain-containing protein [Thermanaerosceptrum fracticalcis]